MINPNSYNWSFTPANEVTTTPSETIQGLDYAVQELLNMYATNQLPSNLSHAQVFDDAPTAVGAILHDGNDLLSYSTCKDKLSVAEYLDEHNPDTIKTSRVVDQPGDLFQDDDHGIGTENIQTTENQPVEKDKS